MADALHKALNIDGIQLAIVTEQMVNLKIQLPTCDAIRHKIFAKGAEDLIKSSIGNNITIRVYEPRKVTYRTPAYIIVERTKNE